MNARVGTVIAIVGVIAVALLTTGVPKIQPPPAPPKQPALQLDPERIDRNDVKDGQWTPPDFPMRMNLPSGWVAVRRNGRPYLVSDPDDALAGNFNLLRLPNLFGKSIDALLEENRAELRDNPQFEIKASGIVTVDGAKAARLEYVGKPRGAQESVTCLCHIFLSGPNQVILTATVRTPQYPALSDQIQGSLASLKLIKSAAGPAASDKP